MNENRIESMRENRVCPCCGRHCDLSEPHCERGKEYLRTGVIPERREGEHGHGHRHEGEDGHGHGHRHDGEEDHGRRHGREGGHRHEHGSDMNRAGGMRRTDDYETMDKDSKLIMNLRDAGHMIRFLFEGKGSQKRILIILLEKGSMTQRELTERLGIQPGSASEVIGKLESAGLIIRMPSETDRRTADVHLTVEGRAKAEDAALQRKNRHQEMFSCLSEEEKDSLLLLAEKLNGYWDEQYRERD